LRIALDAEIGCWLGPTYEDGVTFASGALRRIGGAPAGVARSAEVYLVTQGSHYAELTAFDAGGSALCVLRDDKADGLAVSAAGDDCDGAAYAELALWSALDVNAPPARAVPAASTQVLDASVGVETRVCPPSDAPAERMELGQAADCWVGPTWEEGITLASGTLQRASPNPDDPRRMLGVSRVANYAGRAEMVAYDAAGVALCRVSSPPGQRGLVYTLSPSCNGAAYAEVSFWEGAD
jgi:hypothetical protein